MQADSPRAADAAGRLHGTVQGQPCIRLHNAHGDSAVVALHGAQVLSWQSADRERLYLSPQAVMDGQAAIRGGVPVVFPQFNQRGPLPKHGFARNLRWAEVADAGACASAETAVPTDRVVLQLSDSDATHPVWPHAFTARLTVTLGPNRLRIALDVCNNHPVMTAAEAVQSQAAWAYTAALHTYLRVDDAECAQLTGLDGCARWDALTDLRGMQQGPVGFSGEYDSVFQAAASPLLLCDGPHRLAIAQSPSWGQTVVWNPGAALCGRLSDMPPDGYRSMLCVEAAQIDQPVVLAPQARWQGWQELTVLPAQAMPAGVAELLN